MVKSWKNCYFLKKNYMKRFLLFESNFGSNLQPRKIYGTLYNSTYFSSPYNQTFKNLSTFTEISFHDKNVQRYLCHLLKEYSDAEQKLKSENDSKDLWKVVNNLQPLIVLNKKREALLQQIEELETFISDLVAQKDQELINVAEQEKQNLVDSVNHCQTSLLNALVPEKVEDDRDIVMEFTAGVGGKEAMLFTKLIFDMYCKYAIYKGWSFDIIRYDEIGLGGIRSAHISINGTSVYKMMKHESGVHRVQRIPKTEKAGRVHTSTMTIAVLPQPTDVDVSLSSKDVEMTFKRSSGAGGQHVNTTDSCVRLVHIATGIMVECQMERDQHRNRELAYKLLRAKLYQRKLDKIQDEEIRSRKLQIGTAARSDKIRTYNFPQDRLTDHRIQKNIYDIEQILEGEQQLDHLLMLLQSWSNINQLNYILREYD